MLLKWLSVAVTCVHIPQYLVSFIKSNFLLPYLARISQHPRKSGRAEIIDYKLSLFNSSKRYLSRGGGWWAAAGRWGLSGNVESWIDVRMGCAAIKICGEVMVSLNSRFAARTR